MKVRLSQRILGYHVSWLLGRDFYRPLEVNYQRLYDFGYSLLAEPTTSTCMGGRASVRDCAPGVDDRNHDVGTAEFETANTKNVLSKPYPISFETANGAEIQTASPLEGSR